MRRQQRASLLAGAGTVALALAAAYRSLPRGWPSEAAPAERDAGDDGLAPPRALRPEETPDCGHGWRTNSSKLCTCSPGWQLAGITDTADFLTGRCVQFQCTTDQHCRDELQLDFATCPVRGWNCYCGWQKASSFFGPGYQTDHKGGAACMGALYTFSVWSTYSLEYVLSHAWKYFAAVALAMLPLGRKRCTCDHHRMSLWHVLRTIAGHPPSCHGTCLGETQYSWMMLKDDFAWSLYALDLGVWFYLFCIQLYIICMFAWSIVLWLIVMLTVILACIVGLVGLCGECAAGAGCSCCDCSSGAGAGGCCCCDGCAFGLGPNIGGGLGMSGPDVFYMDPYLFTGGYGGGYGGGGGGGCDECCDPRCWNYCCCKPFASLAFIFPLMPENMWGGLLGFILGTHNLVAEERAYTGGSVIIDLLGFVCCRTGRSNAMHADNGWRRHVAEFLDVESRRLPTRQASEPRDVATRERLLGTYEFEGRECSMKYVGSAQVIDIGRCFDREADGCMSNTWADYVQQECWICQNTEPSWDLWLSCRHAFCSRCSEEMLRRRMPCPLCRRSSTTVLRSDEAMSESSSGGKGL